MSRKRKIVTEKGWNPLEPNKWEAWREDWDLGEPIGVGKTEEEAIIDLLEQEESIIKESIGAVTMVRQPADKLNEPDFRTPIPNLISTTRNSSVPMHWNNAPFMSGGRYGANPEGGKRKVMSYKDFIKAKKKFLKNKAKKR